MLVVVIVMPVGVIRGEARTLKREDMEGGPMHWNAYLFQLQRN